MSVSMSSVWDRTTAFLAENLSSVATIAAVAIFLPSAISGSLAPLKAAGPGWSLALGALSLAFGLVALWAQLAIAAMAIDPATRADGGRGLATQRLPRMILVMLVILAVAVVLSLPIIIALQIGGVDIRSMGQPEMRANLTPGLALFLTLYLLVMVPVVMFLVARFCILTTAIVVAEGQGVAALGRSYRVTSGLSWKLIGVILLYGIVMMVCSMAATTVFGALFSFLFQSVEPVSTATVLTAIVEAAVGAVFSVIGTVFPAKLYKTLSEREGAVAAAPPASA